MMQDFRDSPNYKLFESCRPNRDKFMFALKNFEEHSSTDVTLVKKVAIEAMAYNEDCLNRSRSVDLSSASPKLKSAYLEAQTSYVDRTNAENAFLTAIITNDVVLLKKHLPAAVTSSVIERNKFSNLELIDRGNVSYHMPGWVVAAVLILIVAALSGYLRKDRPEDIGLIRFSFGIFKGLLTGIKDEIGTLKTRGKKDNNDV